MEYPSSEKIGNKEIALRVLADVMRKPGWWNIPETALQAMFKASGGMSNPQFMISTFRDMREDRGLPGRSAKSILCEELFFAALDLENGDQNARRTILGSLVSASTVMFGPTDFERVKEDIGEIDPSNMGPVMKGRMERIKAAMNNLDADMQKIRKPEEPAKRILLTAKEDAPGTVSLIAEFITVKSAVKAISPTDGLPNLPKGETLFIEADDYPGPDGPLSGVLYEVMTDKDGRVDPGSIPALADRKVLSDPDLLPEAHMEYEEWLEHVGMNDTAVDIPLQPGALSLYHAYERIRNRQKLDLVPSISIVQVPSMSIDPDSKGVWKLLLKMPGFNDIYLDANDSASGLKELYRILDNNCKDPARIDRSLFDARENGIIEMTVYIDGRIDIRDPEEPATPGL